MADELPDAAALATGAEPLRRALHDLEGLADGFGRAMTTAFRRAVIDGKQLDDVLRSLALGLSGRALNAAFAPLGLGLGKLISGLFGGMTGGGLGFAREAPAAPATPFTAGGLVATPSYLRTPHALGLTSEFRPAEPPPAPGADGRPGARGGGRGTVSVTVNVTTPDAQSFRRAEADLTAMLARAVARGQRGL